MKKEFVRNTKFIFRTSIIVLASLLFLLIPVSVIAAAQDNLLNYDFNSGSSYDTLSPVLAPNITTSLSAAGEWQTYVGTASGSQAFVINGTPGNAIAMSNSSGNNTKFWTFQLGGSSLSSYANYQMYLQARRSQAGAQTITVAYSTDGNSYTNFGTTMALPVADSFSEKVFDLSGITAINNQSTIYIRVMASGATSTGTLRIDNFQIRATDNTAPTFTINDGTSAVPVQSDTINITTNDPNLNIASLEYGFSADNICNVSDTYGNLFTNSTNFFISGNHTDYLCVTASDNGGNIGYGLVGQLHTDNIAPTILNITSTKADGAYKTGTIIDIALTFSENVTSTGNVTVTLDTGGSCSFTIINSNTGSCNYTVSDGENSSDLNVFSVSGVITDIATNSLTNFTPINNLADNKDIIIDTTAPTVPGIPTTTIPNDSTPTWSWLASTDSGSGLAITPYSVQWCQAISFSDCEANVGTSITNSYTHSIALADGTWYFKVKSVDQLANESAYSSTGQVFIDTIAPFGPTGLSFSWNNDNNIITVTWTAAIDTGFGLAGYSYIFDTNPGTIPDTAQDIGMVTTVSSSELIYGKHYYFHIRAVDNLGNWGVANELDTFLTDETAPKVPGIPVATIGSNLTSQEWSWTASTDPSGAGISHYHWRVDGGPSGTTNTTTVTTNLTPGDWKFHVKAENNAGKQSAESESLLAVLSSSIHQIVVDCSVPLVYVVNPYHVSEPILDLSPLTDQNGEVLVANINCEIRLKSLLPFGTVMVDIPAGATIKGPISEWTKVIIPPVSITPPMELLPAAPTGFSNQVDVAILIGHSTAPLDITKGVRVFLEGQAGKKVGHITKNVFTEITNLCADDSQFVGDALTPGQDCKLEDGSNLIIWTKHFSKFVTYDLVSSSMNSPPQTSSISSSLNASGQIIPTSYLEPALFDIAAEPVLQESQSIVPFIFGTAGISLTVLAVLFYKNAKDKKR